MKKLLIFTFIISTFNLFAQGEANNWFFGKNAGLDFNTTTPTSISGNLSTNEGCASFSKSNGDLLFYTDGITVWNKNHNPMPNGQNLLGDPSSTQSAIIVPHPGNSDLFYVFTVGANDYDNDGNLINSTEGLNCYTVDMTANGGLGNIIGSPIDLSDGKNASWTEKVTSVKGSECKTFWVISLVNNTFYSYKIDDITGLITTPIISPVNFNNNDPRGYLKVSPDGKKLASATYGQGIVNLYSFNDSTGIVSNNGISLITNPNVDGYTYGIEFSPNSSKLYCSTFDGDSLNKLFQFDLDNPTIISSKFLVNSQTGYRGALQLAPNGKIYTTIPPNYNNGTSFLNAITAPDELGDNCLYVPRALTLSTGTAMQGLPPFIASLLLPVDIIDSITLQNINKTTVKRCIGENYQLTAQNIEGNPTYEWTFNGLVESTTATLDLGNLTNASAGTYFLTIETIDDCGFAITYEGEFTIEVYTPPTIATLSNILQCDDDGNPDGLYNFDLASLKDADVLNNQSATEFEVVYFTNQTDANANTNPILNPYTNSAPYSTDIIIARIQNIQNPICYETESFTFQVFEAPNPPETIEVLGFCDNTSIGTDTDGLIIFDLTTKELDLLNNQSASDFTISYFKDATLSEPINDPSSFENTTRVQQIYVEIINNFNSSCAVATSFTIEAFELPSIANYFEFKQCDEDGVANGYTDFNLNEANDYLTFWDTSLTVTYYLNYNDADDDISQINASPFSNQTQTTVFARIENTNGCHRVAEVDLLVSDTHFPENYLKTMTHCDDDAIIDGLHLFDLTENDAEIIALFSSGQNLNVSYFKTLEDAQFEENEIPKNQPYFSEIIYEQPIFVRVESNDNGECFGFGHYLNLIVTPRPEFELDSTAIFCQNLPPITISTYNPSGEYTYEWTNKNGEIISTNFDALISSEGEYTVIATSTAGCESFPYTIIIEPSIIASISQNDITVVDDSTANSITLNTSNLGIGDYEFSIDEIYGNYQDEPYFDAVAPGIHTIYIQDKNNCGITPIEVSVIGYPRFFTPNNDGENDTWKILGVNENFYASSNIYIFDRFGKLITQIDPKGPGWNGLYNGKYLPATDYWFSVELIDNNGNIRIRKGHFSLIRR